MGGDHAFALISDRRIGLARRREEAYLYQMEILLVTATPTESDRLREDLGLAHAPLDHYDGMALGHHFTLVHTGVGIVNAAYTLGRLLARRRFDLGIQVGIAGSFDLELPLGTVVEVTRDALAEMGAEAPEGFLDMAALGFPVLETPTRSWHNWLDNPQPSPCVLPKVAGLTVNTVHGTAERIALAQARWGATVETMEGAAFFYAMLREQIPFLAFRGISNHVTPRNRAAWDVPQAAAKAQDFLLNALQHGRIG